MPKTSLSRHDWSVIILDDYFNMLKKADFIEKIIGVRVLGSFGRFDSNSESDLDIWLICDDSTIGDLATLKSVAIKELSIRSELAKKHKHPNLDRHFSSIFSIQEAEIYDAAFFTRVKNSFSLGEILYKEFNSNLNEIDKNIEIDELQKKADLEQSLIEFVDNWKSATKRNLSREMSVKWLRRIIQELDYQKTSIRVVDASTLDTKISDIYANSPKEIIKLANDHISEISSEIEGNRIETVRLLHSVMWTLEKVRWELINSRNNSEYFGFYPRELGNLIRQIIILFPQSTTLSSTLSRFLIKLTRITSDEKIIDEFNKQLSIWSCSVAELLLSNKENDQLEVTKLTVPTVDSNRATITQIFPIKDVRFAQSELEAWKILGTKDFVRQIDTKYLKIVIQKDTLSDKLPLKQLDKYLSQYVNLIKNIHLNKIAYFGRLNDVFKELNYSAYLQMRLKILYSEDLRIKKIISLINSNKKVLDQEESFLCHMDPGPRNVVISNKKIKLIDFEHASGCSPVWDIERILFQIPANYHSDFLRLYNSNTEEVVSVITRLVMITCFAYRLKGDGDTKNKCLNYIDKLINDQTSDRLVITNS